VRGARRTTWAQLCCCRLPKVATPRWMVMMVLVKGQRHVRGMDAGRPVVMAVATGVTTGPRGGAGPTLIIQVAGEGD
jgi:hypothetical protein